MLKVWSTVKIRRAWVPQNAIVPVGHCHLDGYKVKMKGINCPKYTIKEEMHGRLCENLGSCLILISAVGRPRPYSIIILNMCFIPKAALRASSQITAS